MHRYDAEPAVGPFNAYYTELHEAADGKLLVFDEVREQLGDMVRDAFYESARLVGQTDDREIFALWLESESRKQMMRMMGDDG